MTNRQSIKEKQKTKSCKGRTGLQYGFRANTGTRAGKLDIRAQICQLFPGMAACK
jgi:hypothetical protein